MALREKSTSRQYKVSDEASAKNFALARNDEFGKSDVFELCEEIYRCEMRGDLRQAVELLAPYRTGIDGDKVDLGSLTKPEAARLLLRVGSVGSEYGSAGQINNSQEQAREHLSQAENIFDELDDAEGKAQCLNKTGVTYWRNGDLETAQIYFRESLFYARSDESKAIANLNLAMVESSGFRHSSALKFYEKAYQLIGRISVFTEAKIRNGMGLVYKDIGKSLPDTERIVYFDKAIIEFEGALICYEEVQNSRLAVLARNNIGFLYYSIGLYDEAFRALEAAEQQAREIQDKDHLSIVSDTLARAFVAKGDYRRAIEIAAAAVKYLGSSENSNLLATALITLGIALARSGAIENAKSVFDRAERVAGFIQDFTLARVARLFALREMFSAFTRQERVSSYFSIVKNLSGSQEKDISDALREVAAKIEREIEVPAPKPGEEPPPRLLPISLDEELKSISRRYVEAALRQTGGNQSRSAALLGMSRQTLTARVKKDFPDLFCSFSRKDEPVETPSLSGSDSIDDQTDAGDDELAVTEIQADYREIRRGDLLIVKLGVPEVNKHVVLGDAQDDWLKIGFYAKNESGYFLETAGGGRLELNEAGRSRIIGEVAGFCRRSDCQKSRLAEESNGERKSYELICETLAG